MPRNKKPEGRPPPTPEQIELMNKARREKRRSNRYNISKAGFSVEVVNEIARGIGLTDADRIKDLREDLARFPTGSTIGDFQEAEKSVRPMAKEMKEQASKILDTFDSLPDIQAFFIRPHPQGSEGLQNDIEALRRLKKTLTASAKAAGTKQQSFPAMHRVAWDLARLYEKYRRRPMFSYAGKKDDGGSFIETTPGEKFVGPALEVIFPGITPAQKSTAMRGKKLK